MFFFHYQLSLVKRSAYIVASKYFPFQTTISKSWRELQRSRVVRLMPRNDITDWGISNHTVALPERFATLWKHNSSVFHQVTKNQLGFQVWHKCLASENARYFELSSIGSEPTPAFATQFVGWVLFILNPLEVLILKIFTVLWTVSSI